MLGIDEGFVENVREAMRSIKGNALRSVLTACIIAIGIMALVGILTAIDGLKGSIESSMGTLGAKSFNIERKYATGGRRRRYGQLESAYKEVDLRQGTMYQIRNAEVLTSINTYINGAVKLTHEEKKTNPNIDVLGSDENYLAVNNIELLDGRNFSPQEIDGGYPLALIGQEIAEKLFGVSSDAIGKPLSIPGAKVRIIGVMKSSGGGFGGPGGADRTVLISVFLGRSIAGKSLNYNITSVAPSVSQLDDNISDATGVMRLIRGDRVGRPNSFNISKSDGLSSSLNETTGAMQIGGFIIGFITLLGASIGLMNIMMVSVTERTREIGIRKSLGATPGRIKQQFLIEAVMICQLGGIAGIILGIVLGNVVTRAMQGTIFVIPWLWMSLGVAICLVVGIASGYYPAKRASKLDPIESLRFE